MSIKGMQQSRNKRAGFACKFTHGLLMPNVRPLADPGTANAILFTMKESQMSVRFKVFESGGPENIEKLFEEAAAFASELMPERLIGISHSHGQAGWVHSASPWFANTKRSVVTVWYWDGD